MICNFVGWYTRQLLDQIGCLICPISTWYIYMMYNDIVDDITLQSVLTFVSDKTEELNFPCMLLTVFYQHDNINMR